jgi:hypothetical protein
MFESLSERLGGVFDRLRGRGALNEADVREAMREVRVALLEADVALPVVRTFIDKVTEQAVGQSVLKSITPGQQVVKIVNDALVDMLGIDVGNLQFSDYSVANTVLGTGYGQGLMLGYAADQIRAGVAYTNAQNQVNQNWDENSPTDDWALTGRGEFKIAGDWGQFNDAQSWKGEGFGALVGVGYATARANGANNDPWKLTIDGTVDFGGANLTGAYYWTDSDDGSNQQPGGYTLAGGVFLTDTFELVARWDSIDPDNGGDNITSWTFGGNCYFAKNTAKCGVELGYAPNAMPAGLEYANWVDSNGQDGEWVIRVQMSFSF